MKYYLILLLIPLGMNGGFAQTPIKKEITLIDANHGEEEMFPNASKKLYNGDILIAGYCKVQHQNGTYYHRPYIMKTDKNGNVLDHICFSINSTLHETINDFVITTNGNIVVTGETHELSKQQQDFFVLKLGANFSFVWLKLYHGFNAHHGVRWHEMIPQSILEVNDAQGQHFVICGHGGISTNQQQGNVNGDRVFVLKIDHDGDYENSRDVTYFPIDDYFFSVGQMIRTDDVANGMPRNGSTNDDWDGFAIVGDYWKTGPLIYQSEDGLTTVYDLFTNSFIVKIKADLSIDWHVTYDDFSENIHGQKVYLPGEKLGDNKRANSIVQADQDGNGIADHFMVCGGIPLDGSDGDGFIFSTNLAGIPGVHSNYSSWQGDLLIAPNTFFDHMLNDEDKFVVSGNEPRSIDVQNQIRENGLDFLRLESNGDFEFFNRYDITGNSNGGRSRIILLDEGNTVITSTFQGVSPNHNHHHYSRRDKLRSEQTPYFFNIDDMGNNTPDGVCGQDPYDDENVLKDMNLGYFKPQHVTDEQHVIQENLYYFDEGLMETYALTFGEEFYCTDPQTITVFEDLNKDGLHTYGEPGISNAKIVCIGDNGYNKIAYTDANGEYTLQLPLDNSATYEFTQQVPDGWVITSLEGARQYSQSWTALPQGLFDIGNFEYDECELTDDMVFYTHFEEQSGDGLYNLLGDNGKIIDNTGLPQYGPNVIDFSSGIAIPTIGAKRGLTGSSSGSIAFQNGYRAEFPHHATLDVGNGNWTIEFYIRVTNYPTGSIELLEKYSDPGTGPINRQGWQVSIDPNGRLWFNEREAGVGGYNWGGGPAQIPLTAPTSSTFNHVVITRNMAAGKLIFYVNGVIKGSPISISAINSNTSLPLRMGSADLDGQIDEVSIYKRVLSAAEILDIYNNGKCFDYWKLNDDMVSSANGNYAEGTFTIYNGACNGPIPVSQNFSYTLEGLGALVCGTVNGPLFYDDKANPVALNPEANSIIPYKIPYDAANNGETGCYELRLLNHYNDEGSFTDKYGEGQGFNSGEPATTTAIAESEVESNEISIYPNPAQHVLNITSEELIRSIRIHTIDGKVMRIGGDVKTKLATVDVAQLPKGIYLLEISTDDRQFRRQFIKQ